MFCKTSRGRIKSNLTGDNFWMRSWATCTRFLSSFMCRWNRRLSSSSSKSKSFAASSRAWMRPFQERSAGTWGATAELTPVPITSTSSGARLFFRLGSSFLWTRQREDEWLLLPNRVRVFPHSFNSRKDKQTFHVMRSVLWLTDKQSALRGLTSDCHCHHDVQLVSRSAPSAYLGFFALESASCESAAGWSRFSVFIARMESIHLLKLRDHQHDHVFPSSSWWMFCVD